MSYDLKGITIRREILTENEHLSLKQSGFQKEKEGIIRRPSIKTENPGIYFHTAIKKERIRLMMIKISA